MPRQGQARGPSAAATTGFIHVLNMRCMYKIERGGGFQNFILGNYQILLISLKNIGQAQSQDHAFIIAAALDPPAFPRRSAQPRNCYNLSYPCNITKI